MNDIKQKALAMVDDASPDCFYVLSDFEEERRDVFKALCRAIERHEAFRQKVSDALLRYHASSHVPHGLQDFIIPAPKPDPLVDVVKGVTWYDNEITAKELRAALEARGFEIREKGQ